MRLLSCENPQRVWNKYIQDYVWVPCGKCNICRNKKAAKYTNLLERERENHRYSFFVTLTYSETSIPFLSLDGFGDLSKTRSLRDGVFYGSRYRDNICIPFHDLFPMDKYREDFHLSDIRFFYNWILPMYEYDVTSGKVDNDINHHHGLPYASKTDAQLFLKRLNKYCHDKVTHQFKNFRYFLVSELGSTTFRPHFHAIFFVDNRELADQFADCVSACWKLGIVDTQPVENRACAYVAQYINKSPDLPYVYRIKHLSPFFLCSRNPFIGTFSECAENDAEIVKSACVTTFGKRKASDIQFSNVPLQPSYQNRLFPKCPSYGSLPDSMRIRFYRAFEYFSQRTLKGFINAVYDLIASDCQSDFACILRERLSFNEVADSMYKFDRRQPWKFFDAYSFNYLRRLFYCSRKVACQACHYGLSVLAYIRKILEYYDKRERFLLKQQYECQEKVEQADSIAVMYPQFLCDCGFSIRDFVFTNSIYEVVTQITDAFHFAMSNKKTHFKNAYLDSLALRDSSDRFLYNLIKTYLYGKKCNETLEAFATSCA